MIQDKLLKMGTSAAAVFDVGAMSASSNSNTDILNIGIGVDAFGTSQTPDISNDGEIYWNVACVDEDFASAGSPVVTIDLHTSTVVGMTSASTLLTVATDKTPNIGDVITSQIVPAGTVKQFIATNVAVTAALTAGKIESFLSLSPLVNKRLG